MKRGELKRKTPLRAKTGLKGGKGFSKRKSPQQEAIAQADALIQRVVLERDKCLCQKCLLEGRATPAAEGHHIVHKNSKLHPLRWKAENVVSLCRACHTMDGDNRKPELTAFCVRWVGGQAKMDALRLRAHTDPSEEPGDAIRRLSEVPPHGQ